jgi:hypothetical protein
MGYEMMSMPKHAPAASALLAFILAAPAVAQEMEEAPAQAAGTDIFYSSDADDTQVLRLGLNFDLAHYDHDKYRGIAVEKAWFNPEGTGWQGDERFYLRAADQVSGWKWNVRAGTDGDTILGAAAIHNEEAVRQEYFIEREIVETRQGLSEGIYYTFAGAAVDVPLNDRNVVTLFGGLQEFTGDNVRTHVRANYIHVVKPAWGLSAQLRGRYFRSSHPDEYDYYSPRWYAEILPVAQVRRFHGGWQFLAAAGLGVQRDSKSDWRSSRFLHARVASPLRQKNWRLNASLTYTNTPTTGGFTYSYVQAALGLSRRF